MGNIIGQDNLCNELNKIFNIFKASESEIRPHFILTGSSGSGKTYTIKQLAKKLELDFLEINAAQLTKEGTSGNSLSKALSPLLQMGDNQAIVFVDEFDKLFISGNNNSQLAHESTNGVQNEFLKVLEAEETSVFGDYGKYVQASTKNLLFVFAGAFNGEENINLDRLRKLGIKTEFLGRVGLVYNTNNLTLDNLNTILENSPLLESYINLFEDIDRDEVITSLKKYLKKNYNLNTIGARMVNTLINQYFIKGGELEKEDVKEITFQTKLTLN